MHRALTGAGREPDVTGFALHGDAGTDQVLGRLVARGLHDELKGSAYAIVEGVDGRTHHLQFSDLEMTGDALPGAIVEARSYEDASGRQTAVARHTVGPPARGTDLRVRAPRGLIASSWRGSRPRAATRSALRCAKRWIGASIILSRKVWRAARVSVSSSRAICSTP